MTLAFVQEIRAKFSRSPSLLDLYSGAGGAGMGYHRAGFEVFGVDIDPQANYPFWFHQGDALEVMRRLIRGEGIEFKLADEMRVMYLGDFDAIHASPPCQSYTPLGALHPHKVYPDLVDPTRDLLDEIGKPYVIENVMSAPLVKERSIVLCGGMFGLRTYRHRRFESRLKLTPPAHPKHVIRTATKQRKQRWSEGWHVSITGDVGTYLGLDAMGIDWMTGQEMSEAIPPPYTEWIGRLLINHVEKVDQIKAQALREAADDLDPLWSLDQIAWLRTRADRLEHASHSVEVVPAAVGTTGTAPS